MALFISKPGLIIIGGGEACLHAGFRVDEIDCKKGFHFNFT